MQKLGTYIYGNIPPMRDAVHIAIIPGKSNQGLKRADKILFNRQTGLWEKTPDRYSDTSWYGIDGIVDPFGQELVEAGKWFWVALMPNTILNLRHVWEHASIPPENTSVDPKVAARNWLEGFADSVDMDYNGLIWAAKNYLENGDYVVDGGKYEGLVMPEVFWDYYEIVTDTKVPQEERGHFFSCSC